MIGICVSNPPQLVSRSVWPAESRVLPSQKNNTNHRNNITSAQDTTLPRRNSERLPPNAMTPEQIRRTEEARLKAKALRVQHDADRLSGAAALSEPGRLKRNHSSMLASNSSSSHKTPNIVRNAAMMTTPAADAALRPADKFARSQFIEYDFSKMSDTKGGFLSAVDDPHNKILHVASTDGSQARSGDGPVKPQGMTADEWDRLQLLHKLRKNRTGPFEPSISVLTDQESRARQGCRECGALDVDWKWVEVFACAVCTACKEKLAERYSLLTKTEAREDYLLTNPELNDEELLPHLKRTNPHKSTWNDMQLYLRYQVEEYAFSAKKWGSPAALDAEFERRQHEKKARKDKKFRTKLEELKKRTRTEAYRRNHDLVEKGSKQQAGIVDYRQDDGEARFGMRLARGERHVHEWGRPVLDQLTGVEVKTCVECGAECEEIEL